MKGAIFIALNDMIENQYGLEAWEEILNSVKPKSGGVYTSTQDYDDAEVCAYVLVIAEKLGVEGSEVTKLFGQYLFSELNRKYPIFTQLKPELFDFISSVESVIHKEVRKLFDNPSLPTMDCVLESENILRMEYQSPRKLCHLAEGLVLGASEYYQTQVSVTQVACMHRGDHSCHFKIVKE